MPEPSSAPTESDLPLPAGTSILSRPHSAQLFFVYPGLRRALNGKNPMFLLHSGLAERNLAFLRDPLVQFFEGGLDDNYPSFDAVLHWHRRYAASLPQLSEVYCVGNSSGGFSALEMGHHLKVNAVFAFCPRGPGRGPRLRQLLSEWNGRTEFHIHYSPHNQKDTEFAEALADTPHLTLHPSDPKHNDDHKIMSQMARRGDLAAVFPPQKTVDAPAG
ncbi:hypothetical protein [Shimia sp.]|uniref:hypothetical protein n=1 Tax=Shimia sp. TaxID=1954381 RepID=UPI00356872E4